MADISSIKIGSTTYTIKDASARNATKKTTVSLTNYMAVGGMYSTTAVRFTVHTGSALKPTSATLTLSSVRIRAGGLQSNTYANKTLTAASTDMSNGSVSFTLTGIAPSSGTFTAYTAASVLMSGALSLTY